ncbi:MAG: UvrD-helicase domain-containing protein, partial [Gammaproteobacteria bacterium]|nr:UvrD-helicase domain-containing protein [Gammaproteobacteria bacterium]
MTSPGHFDPLQLPLTERLLLEASAGTGKTHTITTLYLRLLLERELRVEQILVLTFTRAATDELRRRIRGRISDCLDACGDGDDRSIAPESVELLERAESLARARLLLKAALASFDQSAIVTIHGFADRVLRDYAFETGRPLELELEEDLPAQLRMVTLDYWRGITAGASGRFNRYLRANNFTPSSLPRWVETQMNRSAAEIRLPNRSDPEQAEERLQDAVGRLRGIWMEEQENIAALLLAAPLNRNSYGPEKIRGWLLEIGAGLNRDEADATAVLGQKWAANLTPEMLNKRTKKGGQVPKHAFFDQWAICVEAAAALDGVYQSVLIHLRHSALEYVSRELPRRLRQLGTQSYSDLLVELERALQSSRRLADALAAAYPAALVDEFQDTDPLQYGLLQKIYARSSSCVVFVGDPKQAIYQFRGADVYAYLQAARNTPGGGQLLENWRSDPELIGAVNTLFRQREAPFLEPAIRFHPAEPAERQRRLYQDPAGRPEPLQLWWLHRDGEKRVTVEQGQQRAAAATASEVARLLSRESGVGATLAGAPLSGRDISILVATNRQGRLMRLALQQRGLASVFQGDSSVFESEEAEALQRILAAVLDPGERGRLRGALVTDLLGYELAAVASRGLDEAVDHE